MVQVERSEIGRHLPLSVAAERRSPETCRWRCGNQCFHEAPNRSGNPTFEQVLSSALSRRQFLRWGMASAIVVTAAGALRGTGVAQADTLDPGDGLTFQPISLSTADEVIVPPGYRADLLVRWGDPLLPGAPAFDVFAQTPAAQAAQFGYNCDYLMFIPLPGEGSRPRRGVLVVNHEYTNPELMFPGYVEGAPTADQVDVELAAHGLSVVEIRRKGKHEWRYVTGSPRNVRLTAETPIDITGPAAGHPWLTTSEDPTGTVVRGMLNNCAAGDTPWGTVLTCEENFNQYFANRSSFPEDDPRAAVHARYGLSTGATERLWETYHPRFDVAQEPNEAFRFGWVVEIDPLDPAATPRKLTALGRMKHEAATTAIAPDGRLAVYMGDDERFEYQYKFVSAGSLSDPGDPANSTLLDDGTIYVARFHDDGTGEWAALVQGEGPLVEENGFATQGDVLIDLRGAADLVGATMMDRPEDIERNPVTGVVYCVMTNNTLRGTAGNPPPDAANPRPVNRHGHVIELIEDGDDAAATTFTWRIFMLCGDPDDPTTPTYFAGFDPSLVSPISSPDNIIFDALGNLWIATDGQGGTFGTGDGIYAVPVEGDDRGYLRQFLSGPVGAEICGPTITADGLSLFAAIQHPGEGGTFEAPISSWPDGHQPVRPAVIAVAQNAGRPIGT